MLPELVNNPQAQLSLMVLIAEKNNFDRTKTVKDFLVVSGMSSQTRAYQLFKHARKHANYLEEAQVQKVKFLSHLDKALSKAVTNYENTGKNVGDIVALGNLLKEILISGEDQAAVNKANTVIQNNVNFDEKSLKALAEEITKETIDVKPDEFKSRFT